MTLTHPTNPAHDFVDRAPAHEVTWTDPVTGATGFLVVHTLVCGIATGGTRMRPGCTRDEVADLARGMATKTAAFGLPVGGAKGGIDFDPKDPRAFGVLTRFFDHMRPWLDGHWVTAEDLGVTQQLIDEVFEEIGLSQSFHAAIIRSPDPAATLARVHAGLEVMTDGLPLGDIIGGYGVAEAVLGVADGFGWEIPRTEVTIQGVGTMGGGAAWYLHEAGARVTAVADARGTLHDPEGLDIPALLDLRDVYGEIDRSLVPERVARLDRDAIVGIPADVFVPAAVSYAVREDNVERVAARVVVEAANAATTWGAEDTLTAKGVPVVPDFIANTGAAAWAWWLLQGQVGTEPQDSFRRLSTQMRSKVAVLAEHWSTERIPMRQTAFSLASTNLRLLDGAQIVIP